VSNELITTLAEKFGASAALIQRSVDARAAAQGSTADVVLAAWSGGSTLTPAAPAIEAPPQKEPEPEPPPVIAPVETPVTETPEAPALPETTQPEPLPMTQTEPVPAGSLNAILVGAVVLFAIMFVVAVVAPISAGNARTLDAVETIVLSSDAVNGLNTYLAEGCAYCHTQQVRPVVTDADLGIVTLSESPLIPGWQRQGPDLAHVGSRQPTDDPAWLAGYLDDPEAFRAGSTHASFGYLSPAEIADLVTYLLESK